MRRAKAEAGGDAILLLIPGFVKEAHLSRHAHDGLASPGDACLRTGLGNYR